MECLLVIHAWSGEDERASQARRRRGPYSITLFLKVLKQAAWVVSSHQGSIGVLLRRVVMRTIHEERLFNPCFCRSWSNDREDHRLALTREAFYDDPDLYRPLQ